MSVVNRNVLAGQAASAVEPCIEVRWSCTVTKWTDRFGLLSNGQRHGRVECVVTLMRDVTNEHDCSLDVKLVMHDRCTAVHFEPAAKCSVLHEQHLTHVDVTSSSGSRLLALSFHADQLIFAQSSLLRKAGFTGGSYDPPKLAAAPRGAAIA